MASSDAPISIGQVTLVVNDLDQVATFYANVMGLEKLAQGAGTVVLGAGDRPLVKLIQDRSARYRPKEAGLFHTAFLLPNRSDLGAWLRHTSDAGVQLDGASDHLVSEALYLQDPEGNGIEVYWDRPRDEWAQTGDQIKMDTLPLALSALAQSADKPWSGAPDETVIGHVHLQVGSVAEADTFFTTDLGMTKTFGMPTAGWYGSGGYHHHLAGNIWRSQNAGQRSQNATGLSEVELLVEPGTQLSGTIIDPWGTTFTTTAQPTGSA